MKLHWSVLQKELIFQILPHLISTYPAHCTVLQYAWHGQVQISLSLLASNSNLDDVPLSLLRRMCPVRSTV